MPGHFARGLGLTHQQLGVAVLLRSAFDLLTASLNILAGARNSIAARRKRGDRKQHDENNFVFHKHLLSGRENRSQHTAKGQSCAPPGRPDSQLAAGVASGLQIRAYNSAASQAAGRWPHFVTRPDQTP